MHLEQSPGTHSYSLVAAVCRTSCRAQSDKIFAQQSSLGKAQEEVRALRGQLEARAAQQGVIEGEIRRQVEEYGRLKRQLVEQEELQVGCGRHVIGI
jgi:peptidoglycan hydrolase CwlO-like protein